MPCDYMTQLHGAGGEEGGKSHPPCVWTHTRHATKPADCQLRCAARWAPCRPVTAGSDADDLAPLLRAATAVPWLAVHEVYAFTAQLMSCCFEDVHDLDAELAVGRKEECWDFVGRKEEGYT